MNIWDQINKRFYWNREATTFFSNSQLLSWTLIIICGYVGSVRTKYYDTPLQLTLISRIECSKPSSNFSFYGVNDNGEVARFVETEQLVIQGNRASSFIILRVQKQLFFLNLKKVTKLSIK